MNKFFPLVGFLWLWISAFSTYAQVPDSLRNIPDDSVRALALGDAAVEKAVYRRDFSAADQLLVQAQRNNAKRNSEFVHFRLLRDAGLIEQSRKANPAAIRFLQDAYEGFRKLKNPRMQVDALMRLEQVHFAEGEFGLAEKYTVQALDILQKKPLTPAGNAGGLLQRIVEH